MRKSLLASVTVACGLLHCGFAAAQSSTVNGLQPDVRSMAGGVNPTDVPEPGSIRVRLGGHVNFYAAAISDSGERAPGFKQANYGFGDYLHLNPSVDGVAANGLRYGTFGDIWNEKPTPPGGGTYGSISNVDRTAGALYVRRAWVYAGLPSVGTIRVGSGDSPAGLFETGTFENFNDGGWNGDVPLLISGNASPVWPFALVGNLYTPTKVTYLSPQFHGLEFGVSYEPNTSQFTTFDGSCATASTGCGRLSSSNQALDLGRRRNMVNPELRYRAVLGGVGVAAELGYMGSGHVTADPSGPGSTITANTPNFRGFNMGIGGIALTYGGLTVGGHVQAGAFNSQWGLAPRGGPDAFAWIAGASYAAGPVIVGGSFFQYDSAGNSFQDFTAAGRTVGQLRERGVAAGGTYTVVSGLSLFLSYLYGDRKESNYDLLNGVVGTKNNNVVHSQLISVGTQLRW